MTRSEGADTRADPGRERRQASLSADPGGADAGSVHSRAAGYAGAGSARAARNSSVSSGDRIARQPAP
jgi:hypothetical protein